MASYVTTFFMVCYLSVVCVVDKSLANQTCVICDSGWWKWDYVVLAPDRNQEGCLTGDPAALVKYQKACPKLDGKTWAGCSIDIFYSDWKTYSGSVTRVHRSCYPAEHVGTQSYGECRVPLPGTGMGAGSVWCYCTGDSCNYYNSTQKVGK